MSSGINKTIQQHVKSKCASYAGNGRCLLDKPCPFFDEGNESARCIYYENGVLPEDDKLKARYWARFGLAYWGDNIKTCDECAEGFAANSNAQKYCKDCASIVKARQKSAQNRRNYQKNKRGN